MKTDVAKAGPRGADQNDHENQSGAETGSTDAGELWTPPSPHSVDGDTEEELLARVPRNELMGELLSVGSTSHDAGTCKPCVFAYNESKPCQNGVWCGFCHYVHPPKKRVRLCKKKRTELKRLQVVQQSAEELQVSGQVRSVDPPDLRTV